MKAKPVYPPLFALFPLVSLYSSNLSLVPPQHLLRSVAVVLTVTAVLWLLGSIVFRSPERGAMAATSLILGFFSFSTTYPMIEASVTAKNAMLVWVGAVVVGSLILTLKAAGATRFFNIMGVLLLLSALGQVGMRQFRSSQVLPVSETDRSGAVQVRGPKPDIFYIILDGFGRSDSLQRYLGIDNSGFIRQLEKRGFFVAGRSHANYCQTELSIASALNLDQIPVLLPKVSLESGDRTPLSRLIDDNEVARRLRQYGYSSIAVTTGFPGVRFQGSDLVLRRSSAVNLFEIALLRMTPLGVEEWTAKSLFIQRRDRLMDAFQNLENLAQPGSIPKFVQAHILAPHPPFVFDAQGNMPPRKGPFGFWDGSDYLTHVGSEEDYRRGYEGQLVYVQNQILRVLDALLERPGTKPIVVLQGDHGSKLKLDQNSLDNTELSEAFPILNAYFVPEAWREKLYQEITPYNTFRLILSEAFGEHLPLLPDRSWYSTYPLPYRLTDVTPRLTRDN